MKRISNRAGFRLLMTSIALIGFSAATNRATAQVLGSPGDTVEVTWAGKPTKGRIDSCTSTACHLFLYDDVSERWSDGTAFFPKNEMRGLKDPIAAETAAPAAAAMPQAVVQPITAHATPTMRVPAPTRPQEQVVAAAGATVGAIPAGHYACDFDGGGSAGYVDIRGNTYRGPTLDASGSFRAYALSGAKSISWTAGFGEFSVVSSQFMGPDTNGRPWFAVTYSRTHGGGVDRLDCLRE